MNLSFPAVQPGTEEPRDIAYLQQLAAPVLRLCPPRISPPVQQSVALPPASQQASLPALERRAPSSEAPRAGVNSMFGL
jgi:hypothetical protein